MSKVVQSTLANQLLARLPAEDYQLLAPSLERIDCPLLMTYAEADEPMASVFFLESGIASMVVRSPEGQATEAGMVGRDGFVAAAAVLGSDRSPHHIQAQIPGIAHRISRATVIDAMGRSPVLRDTLLRFAHVAAVQSTYTLLSNTVHHVDERLARWLLMCHDRIDSDEIPLTHEFMSLMLAVRRPSVTNALHVLEGNGFIRAERGQIAIRNRRAMEEFAGDAYGKPEAEYQRLLGPLG